MVESVLLAEAIVIGMALSHDPVWNDSHSRACADRVVVAKQVSAKYFLD